MILDGLTENAVRDRFPEVYQWIFERVKPERDHNRMPIVANNWWLFGGSNAELRSAIAGLHRYIATQKQLNTDFLCYLIN